MRARPGAKRTFPGAPYTPELTYELSVFARAPDAIRKISPLPVCGRTYLSSAALKLVLRPVSNARHLVSLHSITHNELPQSVLIPTNASARFGFLLLIPILVSIGNRVLKTVGMWKRARNNQLARSICIAIFNTVGILPIVYLFLFQKADPLNQVRTSVPIFRSISDRLRSCRRLREWPSSWSL